MMPVLPSPAAGRDAQPASDSMLPSSGEVAPEPSTNVQSGPALSSGQDTRPMTDSFRAWSALSFLPDMTELSGNAYVKKESGADDEGVARIMAAAKKIIAADVQFQTSAKVALCSQRIASPEELVAALSRRDLDVELNQEKLAERALSDLGPELASKVNALGAKLGPNAGVRTNWKDWLAADKRSLPEILHELCR
jgi:hypothetical protein